MSSVKYSAIAQNTYKFINEVTIGNIGDIQDPKSPRLGYFKVISNNNAQTAKVSYCMPKFGVDLNSTSETVTYQLGHNYNSGANYGYDGLGAMFSLIGSPVRHFFPNVPETYKVEVNGETYFGFKNCPLIIHCIGCNYQQNKAYLNWSYGNTVIPKCKVNIVKYDATTQTIVAQSYDMSEFTDPAGKMTSSTSSYYSYCRIIWLNIPKAQEDLILAVTVEYPKYDVTINGGNSVQYSIDDGLTYNDLSGNSMKLDQIEHVMFKNTDTINHTITRADGTVVTIIPSAIYVLTPTEDENIIVA